MDAQNPNTGLDNGPELMNTMNPDGSLKSPEQLQQEAQFVEFLEAAQRDGIAFCAGFMPRVAAEPRLLALLDLVVSQQIEAQPNLAQMIEDIVTEGPRKSHPIILLRVLAPDPELVQQRLAQQEAGIVAPDAHPIDATKVIAQVMAPKSAPEGGVMDVEDVFRLAQVFGFLLYPPLRALMQAHGLKVTFHQARETAKKSPIIHRG